MSENWVFENFSITKPEVHINAKEESRAILLRAGASALEQATGVYKGRPCLIIGSGPTYDAIRPDTFDGLVMACNAAAIEEHCDFAVIGDPPAANELLKDLKVPTILRTDDKHAKEASETIASRREKEDYEVYVMLPPSDMVQMTDVKGTPCLYSVRMTGTVACLAAGMMGCSPIILAGLDYLPYSLTKISRYDVTKWYKPAPIYEANLAPCRRCLIPHHWMMEISITETWAREVIFNGGLVFRASKEGLMKNIPVLPECLKKGLRKGGTWMTEVGTGRKKWLEYPKEES
ncbi:MAG: hypothetical protein GY937_19965 [bacterium]|nr:hypothetical protein [bacterium]